MQTAAVLRRELQQIEFRLSPNGAVRAEDLFEFL